MSEIFFEKVNQARMNYPYMDFDRQRLNYFSHFHEEIEIVTVISGEVSVVCENEKFCASAGDICIFMPGEIHSFSSFEENHTYVIKISCNDSVEDIDFYSLRISPAIIKVATKLNDELMQSIKSLKHAAENVEKGYSFLVKSISCKIVYQIMRSGSINKLNTEKRKKNITTLSILKKSGEYIEKHYKDSFSLADIAQYCGYSKYYFAHYFKEITGQTFYHYLTAYRIEQSIPELLNSKNTISAIAYNCGFLDVRSFNRAFKSIIGMTPSEYRVV